MPLQSLAGQNHKQCHTQSTAQTFDAGGCLLRGRHNPGPGATRRRRPQLLAALVTTGAAHRPTSWNPSTSAALLACGASAATCSNNPSVPMAAASRPWGLPTGSPHPTTSASGASGVGPMSPATLSSTQKSWRLSSVISAGAAAASAGASAGASATAAITPGSSSSSAAAAPPPHRATTSTLRSIYTRNRTSYAAATTSPTTATHGTPKASRSFSSSPSPRPSPPSPSPSSSPPLPLPTVMTSFPAHLRSEVLANGVMLIDKPTDWEVPEVVAVVQRATGAAKVASVAPLDGCASGLVLLCFGAATRLASKVERAPKRYQGSLVLGSTSRSGDVRGGSYRPELLPWDHVTDEDLQEAAESMVAAGSSSSISSPDAVDDGEESGSVGGQVCGRSNGGGGDALLQVVPLRHRLRQLPSSDKYVEEDVGASVCTTELQLREFTVWREPGQAAAGSSTLSATATGSRSLPWRNDPRVTTGGTDLGVDGLHGGGGGGGSIVRFSALIVGRGLVRPLVSMYGRRLRTVACLEELRRTHVGSFSVEDAWPLEAVLPQLERYRR